MHALSLATTAISIHAPCLHPRASDDVDADGWEAEIARCFGPIQRLANHVSALMRLEDGALERFSWLDDELMKKYRQPGAPVWSGFG